MPLDTTARLPARRRVLARMAPARARGGAAATPVNGALASYLAFVNLSRAPLRLLGDGRR